jgi:hypothetical protein
MGDESREQKRPLKQPIIRIMLVDDDPLVRDGRRAARSDGPAAHGGRGGNSDDALLAGA